MLSLDTLLTKTKKEKFTSEELDLIEVLVKAYNKQGELIPLHMFQDTPLVQGMIEKCKSMDIIKVVSTTLNGHYAVGLIGQKYVKYEELQNFRQLRMSVGIESALTLCNATTL